MSLRQSLLALVGVLALVVVSCNILKKGDSDEVVRDFLITFQNNLKQPDDVILKQFDTKQSREAIMAAVLIMQDKHEDAADMRCNLLISNATITRSGDTIHVAIPAEFSVVNRTEAYTRKESMLVLHLTQKPEGGLVIVTLEGKTFYTDFRDLRYAVYARDLRDKLLTTRLEIHARAKELQKQYDSVVWYTTYQDRNYYYVVNGQWGKGFDDPAIRDGSKYRMGLVDAAGTVVIPVEYELIGTLGFIPGELVEVIKSGKVGYFDLASKKVTIEPQYSMIIPYTDGDVYALVKNDTAYGWIDKGYAYHTNLPSDSVAHWVKTFQYLPEQITLADGQQSICEIPNERNAGYGYIIPPSFYVQNGLLSQVVGNIARTDFEGWGGGIENVEASRTLFEKFTDRVSGVLSHVTENYLNSRDGFYVKNQLVFVSPENDTLLNVPGISGHYIVHMRRVGGNLVEIKTGFEYEGYEVNDSEAGVEYDLPAYTYYMLGENGIHEVQSGRRFNFTEFAKMDSSYIKGPFHYGDRDYVEHETEFFTLKTLQYMRGEILKSYHYHFTDSVDVVNFGSEGTITKVEDLNFNEVDRHNVTFLDKVIGLLTSDSRSKPI